MTILHLDYETRSVADLRAVGLYEYVAHPMTQVLCAAYAFDDDAPVVWDALTEPMPADLRDALAGGVTVSAWNAAFEREVTRRVLGLAVPDAVWSCSMARAAAMGLPLALERFVAVFCPDVPKDMAGNRQMQQCARPRRLTEDGTPVWWEDAARLARVRDYCAQDVRAEQAADRVLRPLSETERRVWHLDQAINARGMAVDRVTARGAARVAAAVTAEAGATLATLTRGAVTAATQHGRVTDWLRAEGVDVVSVDKDGTAALLADPSLPETARAVLTVRQDVARTSTAKLDTMLAWTATDGRARGMFQYSAAHTGRWGGRGPQPQNFPRPELKTGQIDALLPYLAAGDAATLGLLYPPMLVVASSLRRMLTAAPGQMLVAADYSAIEPRVLAWVAGQDDALARMRGGKMVEYEVMAGTIYSRPVSAIAKDSAERQLGKAAVLGCFAPETRVLTDRGWVPIVA
ncbi:MAG: hypothetical protein MUF53_09320, partial [Gemmatimonadaceae bacterium]|nr:hypothetical protein [Gemmatimonadaceae bacterium]